MKKKLLIILLITIPFIAEFLIIQYIDHEKNKPIERDQLLLDLERYVGMLSADYSFVKGFIPELADKTGGTLPLLGSDQFDSFELSVKYNIMDHLTNYLPDAEAGRLINLKKRHVYDTIIIETPAGRYQFSKRNRALTIPSGKTIEETDFRQ